jgi:hypothetical protein
MNIYLLSQSESYNYDTYSSCVVCAENEKEARRIHPRNYSDVFYDENKKQFLSKNVYGEEYVFEDDSFGVWTNNIEYIEVKYLGVADNSIKKGVLLSSYNAG